jgi:hypothetical protein
MTRKTKVIVAATLIAATLALSSCSGGNRTTTDTGWVTAQYVNLPDGRKVICVMSDTKISCDWEHAK